jgi:hypothetical protein
MWYKTVNSKDARVLLIWLIRCRVCWKMGMLTSMPVGQLRVPFMFMWREPKDEELEPERDKQPRDLSLAVW